ncbi:hypothetical protein DAKH74_044130 [Maudiozyma humilis]|uniref:Reverse transcriptase Ty1/copia-type domain-containing protein n=1 Tax=Maudiozyma humilis TaxID=51915 RepID=A0AAV5S2H3_MAUHU|nr:hypothetical protein DAKH74_044130 [Kazachstania humilis]
MGRMHKCLGMVFKTTKEAITIDQKAYLQELLKDAIMEGRGSVPTPMVTIPTPIDKDESPLLNEEEATQYRSIVGGLLCSAVCTRPDLMYTVSKLGSRILKRCVNDKTILKRTL